MYKVLREYCRQNVKSILSATDFYSGLEKLSFQNKRMKSGGRILGLELVEGFKVL